MIECTDSSEELAAMFSRQLSLYESGQYHDFVLKCGDRSFKVHRNIICPQSAMLRVMCKGHWKESETGEADLNDHDPDVVDQGLRFLYDGKYDNRVQNAQQGAVNDPEAEPAAETHTIEEALHFNIKVYILADYLMVDEMQKLALKNCTTLLGRTNNCAALVEPIAHALHNTQASDVGLRPQVLRSCALMHKSVKACDDLSSVLEGAEPLAWLLQVQACEKEQNLNAQITTAEATLKTETTQAAQNYDRLKDALTQEQERATDRQERYNNAVRLVNRYKECRNSRCNQEFGARLDESEPDTLRCRRCKCKHHLSDIAGRQSFSFWNW